MKVRSLSIILVFIVSFLFMAGCSDLLERFGDKIPFLAAEEETLAPTIHELNANDPMVTSTPPGDEASPGETSEPVAGTEETPEGATETPEGQPPADGGTETTTTPEGGDAGTPAEGGGEESPAEVAGTEPPAEGGDAAPSGPEETAAEDTSPAPASPEGGEETAPGETSPTETPTLPAGVAPAISDTFGMDIAMLTVEESADEGETISAEDFYYDTRNRRDPFRPFTLRVETAVVVPPEEMTPLMKYKLSQLTLRAIIYDPEMGTGVAMVEDPYQKGYSLYVGTNVAEGRVVRITEDEVQVEISYLDFYGEEQTRIETLSLAH